MFALLLAASLSKDTPQTPGLKALSALAGCWKAPAQVRGKDSTSIIRGEWHLGGRYFILHVRSVPPAQPYEAAITYGAGEKPNAIGSFWMDTFGGLYEPSLGLGHVTADGFTLDYRFPDAVYTNDFTHVGKGWRWTILEKPKDKPERLFAQYDLTPASCAGMNFGF
ncbi:MAG TPA: hypothetical protein VID20_05295 [Sphingomicrobium sp.]|jgi:hypothetical protein